MDYIPFSNDGYGTNAAQGQKARGASASSITQIILFMIAVFLSFGSAYWFATTYPDKMREILIVVDRFGITEVGSVEQNRIRAINTLPGVTYEERQVLIDRTVFLSASSDMVTLALGNPMCKKIVPVSKDYPETHYWIYFIEGDGKPTRLAFQEGKLVAADKQTALNVCK